MMKAVVVFCATALAVAAHALPVVSDVSFVQADDGEVTVNYTLSGGPAIITGDFLTNGVSIGQRHFTGLYGDVNRLVETDGSHSFKWLPYEWWPGGLIDEAACKAQVTAWTTNNPPDVIVCSCYAHSPRQVQYFPSIDALPGGILSNVLYRSSLLPLKKCHVKNRTVTIGAPIGTPDCDSERRDVTFDEDFWLGVFMFTQGQANAIAKEKASSKFNVQYAELRPLTAVGLDRMRESDCTKSAANISYRYPHSPHSGSMLGRLKTLTGLSIDLATEAQWQAACLAGCEYGWHGIGSVTNKTRDANMEKIGRCKYNGGSILSNGSYTDPPDDCGPELGTAICGSYLPNPWGFYDMIGNNSELVQDEMNWYSKGWTTQKTVEPYINTGRWNENTEDARQNLAMGNCAFSGDCSWGPAAFGCGGRTSNNKNIGTRLMFRMSQASRYND